MSAEEAGKWTGLTSILDVPIVCQLCGSTCRAGDCEPDVDGEGSLGCPVTDCGGIMQEFGR